MEILSKLQNTGIMGAEEYKSIYYSYDILLKYVYLYVYLSQWISLASGKAGQEGRVH